MRVNVAAAARRLTLQRTRFKAKKAAQRQDAAKQGAVLHFDDADLGAGRAHGGLVRHRDARKALFMRLVREARPLPAALDANLERIWRQGDAALASRWGEEWGRKFRQVVTRLREKLQDGEVAAVEEYVRRIETLATTPAIAL